MTRRSNTALVAKALKQTIADHFPYVLLHNSGCGGVAFHLMRLPDDNGVVLAETVMYPNGDAPAESDSAYCFCCKQPLTPWDIIEQNIQART